MKYSGRRFGWGIETNSIFMKWCHKDGCAVSRRGWLEMVIEISRMFIPCRYCTGRENCPAPG